MDKNLRANLVELIGSFFFVYVTAAAACVVHLAYEPRLDVSGVALASGLALAALLTATFAHSPGCLNPAFTVTLWVFKRLDGRRAFFAIVAQLLGAVLAGVVIRFSFSAGVLKDARCGAPHLTTALLDPEKAVDVAALFSGLGVEVILTCLLTLAIFTTLFDPRAPKLGGLGAGLAQVAVVLIGYRLTGGSANPARWFGTVVWERSLSGAGNVWADHAVFWAGPVLGALAGGLLYGTIFAPGEAELRQAAAVAGELRQRETASAGHSEGIQK
jgi:glycerol uptake facilitator-like aquaporin